jgi:VWFA-related protein
MNAQRHFALSMALSSLGTMLCFGIGQGTKPQKKADDSQTIRVAVEMVSLPVVVTTREGKRITDLKKEDFQVFEDGVPQQIAGFTATDEPISIVLALDTSGSTEQKLAMIQNEAIEFVNRLHPDDSVAVLSFASDVNLLEDFSIDRDKNAYGIKETRPGGWTVIYEAVWLALEEVLKPVKERKALVLFTDGVDTASRKASEKETLELAKETYATIYSVYYNTEADLYQRSMPGTRPGIGGYPGGYPIPGSPPVGGVPPPIYGPGGAGSTRGEYMTGHSYLQKLSDASGGIVVDALQERDIGNAFEQIAKELASQYSIGYYPSNSAHDGKFRKVEVKVNRPGVVARTKKGYTAPKPADGKKKK